jgi:hypothetical protein
MTEEEVREKIAEGESAYSLLYDHDKNYETRFKRLTDSMAKLLKDIKKDFPDARYYSDDGTLHLLLGNDHKEGHAQEELVALSSGSSIFNGGGW